MLSRKKGLFSLISARERCIFGPPWLYAGPRGHLSGSFHTINLVTILAGFTGITDSLTGLCPYRNKVYFASTAETLLCIGDLLHL